MLNHPNADLSNLMPSQWSCIFLWASDGRAPVEKSHSDDTDMIPVDPPDYPPRLPPQDAGIQQSDFPMIPDDHADPPTDFPPDPPMAPMPSVSQPPSDPPAPPSVSPHTPTPHFAPTPVQPDTPVLHSYDQFD